MSGVTGAGRWKGKSKINTNIKRSLTEGFSKSNNGRLFLEVLVGGRT